MIIQTFGDRWIYPVDPSRASDEDDEQRAHAVVTTSEAATSTRKVEEIVKPIDSTVPNEAVPSKKTARHSMPSGDDMDCEDIDCGATKAIAEFEKNYSLIGDQIAALHKTGVQKMNENGG